MTNSEIYTKLMIATPYYYCMLEGDFRTPGQLLEAHLVKCGWTQRVLALVVGINEQTLSRVFSGVKPVDAELALSLQAAIGVDPHQLLQIQKDYDLARARLEVRLDPGLTARATLFQSLPIGDMIKRGWLPGITDVRDPALEGAVCRFFGTQTIRDIGALPHAAKKTGDEVGASSVQIAWLHRVRTIADDMMVGTFDDHSVARVIEACRPLLGSPENVRKVPRILSEEGIRFVVVESLPSAKIDGACFWLEETSPVIGMSLRFDRIDNFWFVLRHELEHVRRGDGRDFPIIDSELDGEGSSVNSTVSEQERLANEAAAAFCVEPAALARFIARKQPFFAERDLVGFAKTIGVHPGLVAGQVQRETGRYDRFRSHLSKIRSSLTPNAMTDGWGETMEIHY